MNELVKLKIRRVARLFGIEALKNPRYVRSLHSQVNFPHINKRPVIFDVGANIGQSVIEFKNSLKNSLIYAFEPVSSVYQTLLSNTRSYPDVRPLQLGLGEFNKTIEIPKTQSPTAQTTQVLKDFGGINGETETVKITTVDDFSEAEDISSIDILKTDTEGFDLDVCKGMKGMLGSKRVSYIIAEVSIAKGDTQHTSLFDLRDFLRSFDYELVSLFDLEYSHNGHLDYFNALFSAHV